MIYFDNAATTKFKPASVINAFLASAHNSANPGRGGHSDSIREGMVVYRCRAAILEFLNAPQDQYEVVFTANCTAALNTAIQGVNADCFITDSYQHNSVLRPLNAISKCDKTVSYLNNHDEELSQVMPDNKGALVIANHISNVNGAISDIDAITSIAHAHSGLVLVDCAQSLGHVPIDLSVTPIDMLAGAGHKSLHGVQGVGFLVLRRDLILKPLIYGGTGVASHSLEQPEELPESLESGTLNTCGIHALYEGVRWTNTHFSALRIKYRTLSRYTHDLLSTLRPIKLYSEYPSSVISFNIADIPSSDVADYLNQEGIAVRSGLHCAPLIHAKLGTLEQGAVRVSLGVNNEVSDVYQLYNALAKYCHLQKL